MNRNEKARGGEATPRRAKEQAKAGELCGAYVPDADSSMDRDGKQARISDLLSRGAEIMRTAAALAAAEIEE